MKNKKNRVNIIGKLLYLVVAVLVTILVTILVAVLGSILVGAVLGSAILVAVLVAAVRLLLTALIGLLRWLALRLLRLVAAVEYVGNYLRCWAPVAHSFGPYHRGAGHSA